MKTFPEAAPLWPASRVERAVVVVAAVALTVFAVVSYVQRHKGVMDPYAADGDQLQAVWQYWRYRLPGTFPPGDLLTDYAFVMHAPPLWWSLMASISHFTTPLTAAKILEAVAYVALISAMFLAVARRSHPLVGLAAAFLVVRSTDAAALLVGGYARSFGPALTCAFLGAFLVEAHVLCLIILVIQAALYPSVVLACGLTYGAYTVLRGPDMKTRLRRMAGMTVAGLLIIGFGEYQELGAPKWWGSIVTLEQAEHLPELHAGGRAGLVPLAPMRSEVEPRLMVPLRAEPGAPIRAPAAFLARHDYVPAYVFAALLAAGGWLLRYRRRRAGVADHDDDRNVFPWQIPALALGALAGYVLARQLAFRLYIPFRPLSHVLPFIGYAAIPLLWWGVISFLPTTRRWIAPVVTLVLVVVPALVFQGLDARDTPRGYVVRTAQTPVLRFAEQQPQAAVFAGDLGIMGSIPLFAHHRVVMNANLAHPFRKPYFDECVRRITQMYSAIFATSLDDIVDIAAKEEFDFLVFRQSHLKRNSERIFEPVGSSVRKMWDDRAAAGFALLHPPRGAIVFQDGDYRVLDVGKLKAALARGDRGQPPPPPFIGPLPEPPQPAAKKAP